MTVIPILLDALGTVIKGTGIFGYVNMGEDYPKFSFIKIVQNIEEGPGDLRRIAVTPSANAGEKNSQIIIRRLKQ